MRSKVRAALDVIDSILSEGGQDSRDLAAILSALRGPDKNTDEGLKITTTCAIRTIAFPLTFEKMNNNWGLSPSPSAFLPVSGFSGWGMRHPSLLNVEGLIHSQGHFESHILDAVAAINRTGEASS